MFPTCPACKQSVLDENPVNCPFCGANMKTGKGGQAIAPKVTAKPVAKERPSTPAPAATPTTKGSPAKSAPAASNTTDDDDPFGVDAASNSRAIPLSSRPAKGKTVRLICPMCETPGFAGADSAGKEVKCCNEQCAMPIFTAPKSGAVDPSADPRAPGKSMVTASAPAAKKASPAMLLTAAGALIMAGGSLWFFVFNEPAGIKPPPALPSQGGQEFSGNSANPDSEKTDDKQPVAKAKPQGETLRAAILPVIVDLARVTEKNRSKHFCRRLAAEAFVEAGDLKAARENIDQLLNLAPKLPYHQVSPFTQIAWREIAAGNTEGVKSALDAAWKAAPELPVGRHTFDVTTNLAAALFVSGRADDAQSLMKRENVLPSGSSGMLAALSRRAHLSRSFDLEEAAASLPIIPWKSPQWVVATITLVLRGHVDKGVEWVKLSPDAETKAECWAAWGDAVVATAKSPAMSKDDTITAALSGESPATQARVWARVAAGRLAFQQKESANRAIANATTAMKSVPLPQNFLLPDMKEMMKLDLSDAVTPKLNAIAAAELARAQTLFGQMEPAASSLAAAMQHLRGQSPSPFVAGRLFDATSRDLNAMKAQLKTALNLKTDDKVTQALTTYRGKCRSMFDAANARFSLQTEILKAAVDWPLIDAVWNEATAHAGDSTPPEAREEFLKTNLSVRLGQRLRAAGQLDQARQCENLVTTGELTDARDILQRETADLAEKGDLKDMKTVAKKLGDYQPTKAAGEKASSEDTDWPLLWGLRLACRLVKSGKIDQALDLIESFSGFSEYLLWREEGFEMLAAIIAKDPVTAERVWKKYRPTLLSPTEKIAIFRGLCAGLSASLPPKP